MLLCGLHIFLTKQLVDSLVYVYIYIYTYRFICIFVWRSFLAKQNTNSAHVVDGSCRNCISYIHYRYICCMHFTYYLLCVQYTKHSVHVCIYICTYASKYFIIHGTMLGFERHVR